MAQGDSVFASHCRELSADRVKFYVDRIELSGRDAPRVASTVNTPGALLQLEPGTQRGLTYAWHFEVEGPAGPACGGQGTPSNPFTRCAELRETLH